MTTLELTAMYLRAVKRTVRYQAKARDILADHNQLSKCLYYSRIAEVAIKSSRIYYLAALAS